MQHAKDLIAAGTKVIDLAADFRLQNLEQFEKWYGMEHACLPRCTKRFCLWFNRVKS